MTRGEELKLASERGLADAVQFVIGVDPAIGPGFSMVTEALVDPEGRLAAWRSYPHGSDEKPKWTAGPGVVPGVGHVEACRACGRPLVILPSVTRCYWRDCLESR